MRFMVMFCLICLLTLTACESKEQSHDESAKIPAQSQQTTVDDTVQSYDISKVNVCELLPDELLAKTIGGAILKPSRRSDYGSSQGCEYQIDPAGKDRYEYCAIWLSPAAGFGNPQMELETAHGLGQDASAEQIADLGDAAFVIHNQTEQQSTVNVLLKDKVVVQVTADHYQDARKLTNLALAQIKKRL
ncbi:MAG: hypothetical protein ACE5G1_04830 [bacterium]